MRRCIALAAIALFGLSLFAGCGAYSVSPVTGFLFTDVQAPAGVTDNASRSPKVGTSYCASILGLIATGDASIKAAMADGGITKIHYVDYHSVSYLGLYAKFVVTVYGE